MIEGIKITKIFGSGGLNPLDISVKKGEMVGLCGASGCGKSTLLNILTCMLRPDSGKVIVNGSDISGLSEKKRTYLRGNVIGYVMQKNSLLPELTIMQNILFPSYTAKKSADEKKAQEIAERLAIGGQLLSYPSQLSGGEYRRAMLARILLLNTPIIAVDEPTSNLDPESAEIVRSMLKEANRNGVTVITASHDSLLLECTDRVVKVG